VLVELSFQSLMKPWLIYSLALSIAAMTVCAVYCNSAFTVLVKACSHFFDQVNVLPHLRGRDVADIWATPMISGKREVVFDLRRTMSDVDGVNLLV